MKQNVKLKALIRKLVLEAVDTQGKRSPALEKKISDLKKHYKTQNQFSSDVAPGYRMAIVLEKLTDLVSMVSKDVGRQNLPLSKEELLALVSDAWDMKAG